MLALEFKKIDWWYWVISLVLLGLGLAGWGPGFRLLLVLTVLQCVHFRITEKSFKAFPVQVRIVFLIFLAVASLPPLHFLYWIPVAGLTRISHHQ